MSDHWSDRAINFAVGAQPVARFAHAPSTDPVYDAIVKLARTLHDQQSVRGDSMVLLMLLTTLNAQADEAPRPPDDDDPPESYTQDLQQYSLLEHETFVLLGAGAHTGVNEAYAGRWGLGGLGQGGSVDLGVDSWQGIAGIGLRAQASRFSNLNWTKSHDLLFGPVFMARGGTRRVRLIGALGGLVGVEHNAKWSSPDRYSQPTGAAFGELLIEIASANGMVGRLGPILQYGSQRQVEFGANLRLGRRISKVD